MNANENFVIDEKLVAENSDFLKAVAEAKTIEQAQEVCSEYNVALPEEVWNGVKASYHSMVGDAGELSEDELLNVSGGRMNGNHFLNTLAGIAGLGAVIAAGSPAGVLVACAWIGYHGYKTFF